MAGNNPEGSSTSTMDLQLGREREASCSESVLLVPAAWTSLALALALVASAEVDQLGNCTSTILETSSSNALSSSPLGLPLEHPERILQLLHKAPTVRSTRVVELPQFACKIEGSSPSPPLLSDNPLPKRRNMHQRPLRNHHTPTGSHLPRT